MLERAAALRQWGLRWRKVGVSSAGAPVPRRDAAERARGLARPQAAAQDLAGIAVTGPARALAAYEDAAGSPTTTGCSWCSCEAA